jgi:hypothetical protein
MKNIKLFEAFNQSSSLRRMISDLKLDSRFSGWDFTLDESGDIPFLIWENPADSREWRESGYADDYDGDFSNVEPMPVLAFTEIFGEPFAYMLTPEEKYSQKVILAGDIGDQLMPLSSLENLKTAIQESLWNMN